MRSNVPPARPSLAVVVGPGEYQHIPVLQEGLLDLIMPVVGWTGDRFEWIGSCFSITSTGLLLTAGHVVDEWAKRYADAMRDGTAGIFAIWEADIPLPPQMAGVPSTLGTALQVLHYSRHAVADLAVLQVALPVLDPPVSLPSLALNVAPPSIGDQCVAVGLAHTLLDGAVLAGTAAELHYERQLAVSRGNAYRRKSRPLSSSTRGPT